MQAEDKEPATPPKKTSRRRFLKILAGTACAVGISKGIDLLLPLTLCRPGEWSGPITDHFNGRHFFNPARYGKQNTHKSASVFRWLFRKRVKGHYPEV
ncbi:MAG: twin-arginine translocation signal domain-containing protein, partial [Akkermansia sp.]|nr:twin-arginine translocation signal domain-containing protein [Akkermansia sp.]